MQVFLNGCVEVRQYVDHNFASAIACRFLEHLEFRLDQVLVLNAVICEVKTFDFQLPYEVDVAIGYKPDVYALVEVYPRLAVHKLLKQVLMVFACENVRIAQRDVLLPFPKFIEVCGLVRTLAFFRCNVTEFASPWTASCEEAETAVFRKARIERVIRIDMLYLARQRRV